MTPINSPTPTATGMPAGLTVQYKVGDPHAPCDGYVVPNLHIHNGGSGGVALNKLTIRYWFTADTTQPQNWFPSTVSTSNVTETAQIVTTTAPLSGADHYIQYSFANGGLNPGSDSPDITITLCKPGSATNGQCPSNPEYFDEYNDYSYNPFMTSYQDWDRVTLYYQGTLIWGYEPPSLP